MKQTIQNPWLGLRSYPEGTPLYGRNKEIVELSQKIIYNTQTIIYGRSGIGKSSILNAGVFPVLRKHNLFPVYIRLDHGEVQDSYAKQIFMAVEEALKHLKVEDLSADTDDFIRTVNGYKQEIVAVSDPEKESMWEYFHRHQFFYRLAEDQEPQSIVPVLVFDQFEEIFTLQKSPDRIKAFFNEFADLINNICPKELLLKTVGIEKQEPSRHTSSGSLIKKGIVRKVIKNDYLSESNFHFVISIREDFLSHLERNIQHIPLLKHNRYCLMPLNEDQAAEIIMKPIPGLVSLDVAKEIICKVTGATYDSFELNDNPQLEVDSAILSLFLCELYKKKEANATTISREQVIQAGANIISDVYNHTMAQLSEKAVMYLENNLITEEGRRDTIFLEQATSHGVTEQELQYLFEQRVLNKYPWRQGIRIEFSHDILCPIIVARRNERQAERERIKQQELLRKAQKERRRLVYGIILIVLSVFLAAGFYYDGWYDVKITRYAKIVKQNGWMQGLKELSIDEASHLNCSYWFYQKGRWAKNAYLIEARNGYDNLTTNHDIVSYLVNHYDDSDLHADAQMKKKLATIVRWELTGDNTGNFCIQEKAYDKDGNIVYCLNNSKKGDNTIISTYTDDLGFPLVMRDSCHIYLRTTLDRNGREIKQEYFDEKGFPTTDEVNAFMREKTYFPNGLQKSDASLFVNGNKMTDRAGNCGWRSLATTADNCYETVNINFDHEGHPCYTTDKVMITQWEFDSYGRPIKTSYWYIKDTHLNMDEVQALWDKGQLELFPDINRMGVHGYTQEYNERGLETKFTYIGIDGQPCIANEYEYNMISKSYDENGNRTSYKFLKKDDMPEWVDTCHYDNQNRLIYQRAYELTEFHDTILIRKANRINNKLVTFNYDPANNYYIKAEYDEKDNITLYAKYTIDSQKPSVIEGKWHKYTSQYEYKNPTTTIETTCFYDINGKPCAYSTTNPVWKFVSEIDSVNYTRTNFHYTTLNIQQKGVDDVEFPKDELYEGVKFYYNDKKFTYITGYASIDNKGRICRYNDNPAGYYYLTQYITSIRSDSDGKPIGEYATNEMDEASIIKAKDGKRYSVKIKEQLYDEFGHPVIGFEEPQALLCDLDVNDPQERIQKGDILVEMNEWTFWNKAKSPESSFKELNMHPDINRNHDIKVLRFNADSDDYDLIEVRIPAGDAIIPQIKFMEHYCTKAEKEQINHVLGQKLYPHIFELIPEEGSSLYKQGMKTSGILLKINDWDMSRHFKGNLNELNAVIQKYKGMDKHILVMDIETKRIHKYTIADDALGEIDSHFMNPPAYKNVLKKFQEYVQTMPKK